MTRRSSVLRRTVDLLFWMVVLTVLLAVLSVLSGRHLFDRLDEEIRVRVERKLAGQFPQCKIAVGAARRKQGVGIELNDVAIWQPAQRQNAGPTPLMALDKVLLHCETDLSKLASGEISPTLVEIRGLKISLAAKEDNTWNLRGLLPKEASTGEPIPILIQDIQADVRGPNLSPVKIVDINAEFLPHYLDDATHAFWNVHVRTGAGASQLDVEGRIDPVDGDFVFRCRAPRQEIRPDLLALAQSLGVSLQHWKARGVLRNIDATLWGDPRQPLRYRLACDVEGVRLEHPAIPLPLDNLRTELRLDSQHLHLQNLHAMVAGASLEMSEFVWGLRDGSLRAAAELKQLRFDERLAELLPADLFATWREHHAVGEISRATWSYVKTAEAGVVQNMLNVDCRDLSFHFPSLPYRFHRSHGTLTLRGDRLAINLQAPVGGRKVQIVGDLRGCGQPNGAFGWMEMGTDGPVPLDEKMIAALTPDAQRIVRSFQPQGTLKLWGYVRRERPGEPIKKQTVVRLENLAVNYELLPYPVNRIHGTMVMKDGDWEIDIKGQNDNADIACRGVWLEEPGDQGPHLRLTFHGSQVALDRELQQALPASAQRLWNDMSPTGSLDQLKVGLQFDARSRLTTTQVSMWKLPKSAELSVPLSIRVPGLPYRLEQVTGKVVYENGRALLQGVRAVHGDTVWEAEGTTSATDDEWRLNLSRVVADNLTVDRRLLGCVPADAATTIANMQVRGPIDVDGKLDLVGYRTLSSEDSCPGNIVKRANWDLTLDVEKGYIRAGQFPLNQIRGQVRMLGAVKDDRFAINGELNVDSLEAKGTTFYRVRGPFTMDNRSIRLGTWAVADKPRQVNARVFGGMLNGDAEFKLDGSQEFELAASLSNGQLSELGKKAVPVGGRVAGRAGGTLLLSGTTRGVHSLKGEGYAEMKDADIYEAPVMVSLLQLISSRTSEETSLISNGNANFRIVGDHVYLDRMELDGAIRLHGKGEMTLQREIDMKLYTAMGKRENEPTLPLFREASRRILEIEVGGTLEQPEITRRAFPELNDTLQRLFPETPRRRIVADGLPRLRDRLTR